MNYISIGRTNYFKVKDAAAFLASMGSISGLEVIKEKDNTFCLLAEDGFLSYRYDSEMETDDAEINICDEVAVHLIPGSVAIFTEVGYEGLRVMEGWSAAVDSTGKRCELHLSDICSLAATMFKQSLDDIQQF